MSEASSTILYHCLTNDPILPRFSSFFFHLLLKKSDEKDVDTSSLCPVIARCEILFFLIFFFYIEFRVGSLDSSTFQLHPLTSSLLFRPVSQADRLFPTVNGPCHSFLCFSSISTCFLKKSKNKKSSWVTFMTKDSKTKRWEKKESR